MKKILTLTFVLFLFNLAFSQEKNSDLLIKAKTELNSALEKEDYEKAALLQKEIETRKKIEAAVADGDYELAASLKKQLTNTDQPSTNNTSSKEEDTYTKLNPPSKGKAVVEMIRAVTHDWHFHQPIFLDWKLVGYVKGVSHLRIELEPGEHVIWAPAEKDHFIKINVEEGQTYFIYHDFKVAKWKSPECDLSPILPTHTDDISRGLRIIDKYLSKVLDNESQEIIDEYLKKKKIKVDEVKVKYNQELKDKSKWTKTVNFDQSIPIKYL